MRSVRYSPHFTDEEAAQRVQPLAQGLTAGTLERARSPAQAAGSGAQATQPESVSPTMKQDSEHHPLFQDGGAQKIRFTGKHCGKYKMGDEGLKELR